MLPGTVCSLYTTQVLRTVDVRTKSYVMGGIHDDRLRQRGLVLSVLHNRIEHRLSTIGV